MPPGEAQAAHDEIDLSQLLEDPATVDDEPLVLTAEAGATLVDAVTELAALTEEELQAPAIEPARAIEPAPAPQPVAVIEAAPPQPAPVIKVARQPAPIIDIEPEPAAPLAALVPVAAPMQQPSPNVQILTIPTGDGGHVQAAVNVAVAVSVQVAASVVVAPVASRRNRKPKPVQDEWGFFDPSQCGFPALMAKLDEIADKEDSD